MSTEGIASSEAAMAAATPAANRNRHRRRQHGGRPCRDGQAMTVTDRTRILSIVQISLFFLLSYSCTTSCYCCCWAFAPVSTQRSSSWVELSRTTTLRPEMSSVLAAGTRIVPSPTKTLLSSTTISSDGTLMDQQNDDDNGDYDLAVIGGGVVGVQAALAAAAASAMRSGPKLRVCLIDAPEASGALLADPCGELDDSEDNDADRRPGNDSDDVRPSEKEDLSLGGPTGLFSKALRDTSKRIKVGTLRGMGLREDSVWNEIIMSCVDLARSNARDVRRQLDDANVDYFRGYASFVSSSQSSEQSKSSSSIMTKTTLKVERRQGTSSSSMNEETSTPSNTRMIHASKVIIATGSQPFRPDGIPFDGQRIFDSDSINTLGYLPRSIAITGSGIIAIEFAKIFRNLGADVTLIIRDEVPRRALQKIGLDIDVAATLVADLVRCGIKIERGAEVGEFTVPSNPRSPITIELLGKGGTQRKAGLKSEIRCDCYLAAVGRKPNTQSLNLEAAGIEVDEYGGILVDSTLRTTSPCRNVFAAGDVLGRPFLASTGTAQGRAAVTSMFGSDATATSLSSSSLSPSCDPDDPSCVVDGISQVGNSFDPASLASNPFAFPTGIWSSPEAAYFGLSKSQAMDMGIDAGEGMALYAECLRGLVFSPNGLLKLVFEKATGRILGVHICGDDACELIHYGMELVKSKRTIEDLTNTLYSAVTFHEMYKIAAMNAMDEVGARKRRAAAGKALAARQRATIKNASD